MKRILVTGGAGFLGSHLCDKLIAQGPSATLQEAAQNLSESALRIALVVDQAQNRLLGTLSDGDIRRGLLRGLSLASTVAEVMNPRPLVVPEGVSLDLVRRIMGANKIQQVPEVTADGRVVELHTWEDFETTVVVDTLLGNAVTANKSLAGCLKLPRNRCAKKWWSLTCWERVMRCLRSMGIGCR